MSIARDIMELAGQESTLLRESDNYEASFVWDLLESWVNNVMHGRYPNEYLPMVQETVANALEASESQVEREQYQIMLSILKGIKY